MIRQVVIAPEAEEELDDAVTWRERERLGSGLELRDAAMATLERIAREPEQFPLLVKRSGAPAYRRATLARLPYSVIFIEEGNRIRVLAFAHDRRSAGYWRARH